MAGLRAEGLTVRRGGVLILQGVDLELAPGERLGVFGPSGSGKTTLLRALAGLEPEWEGRLTWEGEELRTFGPRRWRRTVTLLAQRPAMFPGTVGENVAFAARYHGLPIDPDELLEAVGLKGMGGRRAETLSEGEKQRVALARAVAIRPRVLLLDEPTAALDLERVEQVERLVNRLAERSGAATVLVSHQPAQVRRLSARQVRLEGGRIRPPGGLPGEP